VSRQYIEEREADRLTDWLIWERDAAAAQTPAEQWRVDGAGQDAIHVYAAGAISRARLRVNPRSAPFVLAYIVRSGIADNGPVTEEITMILPRFRRIISGSNAFVQFIAPSTFTRHIRSRTLAPISANGTSGAISPRYSPGYPRCRRLR